MKILNLNSMHILIFNLLKIILFLIINIFNYFQYKINLNINLYNGYLWKREVKKEN